ncbi:hypothetical protein LguiB_003137 [Lonicera macranthoides]
MLYTSLMAFTVTLILLRLLLISSSYAHVQSQSTEEGFISIYISDKGLDFVKDLLINKAVTSLVPLQLPQIEKSAKIPVVGSVDMVLSNVVIDQVDVSSSIVKPGETGITIVASGATAHLSMEWKYSYSTWLLPISISDNGVASVQVEGMEVGLTLSLKNQQGNLKLSLLDCGCYVEDISIKLDGGASWLYQGLVDAFEGKISSAVEDAISEKIRNAITNLDTLLQSLPKEILVHKFAALNISLVKDPVLSNSSVDLEIDGLFSVKNDVELSNDYHKVLQASVSCKNPDKMVGISLHENVLNSASLAYFNANMLHWVVDNLPDQSLLNTAGWKYVVPQLYKQFPDDDLNLNISLSSPPIIEIKNNNIVATIYSDVTIDVLDAGEVIPVACISLVISVSGFAELSGNTLGGDVKLGEFTLSLKWSKIGHLHTRLVQSLMSTVIKTTVLPLVNLRLRRGFPLPLFHGYTLENAQLLCADSRIIICSDVASTKQHNLIQFLV